MQTREQQIVGAIAAQLSALQDPDWAKLRSVSQSLPSMMIKHGPVQVILFYLCKDVDSSERKILAIFQAVMGAVHTNSPLATHKPDPTKKDATLLGDLFKEVADQSLAEILHEHALSNEIATWIARSIDARYQHSERLRCQAKGSP